MLQEKNIPNTYKVRFNFGLNVTSQMWEIIETILIFVAVAEKQI